MLKHYLKLLTWIEFRCLDITGLFERIRRIVRGHRWTVEDKKGITHKCF